MQQKRPHRQTFNDAAEEWQYADAPGGRTLDDGKSGPATGDFVPRF
jgi:hypothetical protein